MKCKVICYSENLIQSKKNENYKFKVYDVLKPVTSRDMVVGKFTHQAVFVSENDLHFFEKVNAGDVIDIHYESDGRFSYIDDVEVLDEDLDI